MILTESSAPRVRWFDAPPSESPTESSTSLCTSSTHVLQLVPGKQSHSTTIHRSSKLRFLVSLETTCFRLAARRNTLQQRAKGASLTRFLWKLISRQVRLTRWQSREYNKFINLRKTSAACTIQNFTKPHQPDRCCSCPRTNGAKIATVCPVNRKNVCSIYFRRDDRA